MSSDEISKNLEAAYRQTAQAEKREVEALEWVEALVVDIGYLAPASACSEL